MCDTCYAPHAPLKCDHCHLFRFCSEECSNELAEEHHAVCYDAKSCDMEYLDNLLDAIGYNSPGTIEGAHECIAEHLASYDFTTTALQLIELRAKRRVKRIRKPKKPRKNRVKTVNKAKRKARVQNRRANRRQRRSAPVVRPPRERVVVQSYRRPSTTTPVVEVPRSVPPPTRGTQRVVPPVVEVPRSVPPTRGTQRVVPPVVEVPRSVPPTRGAQRVVPPVVEVPRSRTPNVVTPSNDNNGDESE